MTSAYIRDSDQSAPALWEPMSWSFFIRIVKADQTANARVYRCLHMYFGGTVVSQLIAYLSWGNWDGVLHHNPLNIFCAGRAGQRAVVVPVVTRVSYVTKSDTIIMCSLYRMIWAPSSDFVSSSIPSWQILIAHAQSFRGARDLAFCLKVLLDSLLG